MRVPSLAYVREIYSLMCLMSRSFSNWGYRARLPVWSCLARALPSRLRAVSFTNQRVLCCWSTDPTCSRRVAFCAG
jgi:hypothetical protein